MKFVQKIVKEFLGILMVIPPELWVLRDDLQDLSRRKGSAVGGEVIFDEFTIGTG